MNGCSDAGLFQEHQEVRGPGLEFGGQLVPPAPTHLVGGPGQDVGQSLAGLGFRADDENVRVRQENFPYGLRPDAGISQGIVPRLSYQSFKAFSPPP